MLINDELKALYSINWKQLESEANKIENITHPLLLKVDEEKHTNSDVKVMIFGQETDGWHGEFPKKDAPLSFDVLMNTYYECLYVNRHNRRPFWNKQNFKHFEQVLTKHFHGIEKKVSFLWNNLSKIGKVSTGKAGGEIRRLELNYFDVIKREIEILNPDIIIFTTGHSRDNYIKTAFGKDRVEFKYPKLSFSKDAQSYTDYNSIAKISLADFPNVVAVRVEHPNRRTMDNNLITDIIIDSL